MKTDNFLKWLHPIKGEVKTKWVLIITFFSGILGLIKLVDEFFKFSSDPNSWFASLLKDYDFLFYSNIFLFSLLFLWILFLGDIKKVHYDVTGFFNFEADTKSIGVSFFDSISKQRDISNRFDRANDNTKLFFKYFKLVWLGWFLLYMALLCFSLIHKEYHSLDTFYDIKSIVVNLTNNLTSLFFVFCLLVLNKVSKKEGNKYKLDIDPKWYALILIPLILEIVFQFYFEENTDILFSIISGMIAMISMSLLIGRLDSKLINKLPNGVLIILYGYSGLQVFLPLYLDVDNYVPFDGNMVLVMYLALFCKVVFLLFIFWILNTNRLFFYFLSVYYIHNDINNLWNEKRNALVQKTKVNSEDLKGKWKVKESYFSNNNLIGIVTGVLSVDQFNNGKYTGVITLEDNMLVKDKKTIDLDKKYNYIVEQTVEIERSNDGIIHMSGKEVKFIEKTENIEDDYNLDTWKGEHINDDIIVGSSIDDNGSHGSFHFERLLE